MKFILQLVFVICISTLVLGQATKESIKKRMWESGDPDFEITEVPEKWKNEAAVILSRCSEYEFRKQAMSSNINKDYYFRSRDKILDKSALDTYSKFAFFEKQKNFSWSRAGYFFGVKIIKPDGTEIEIDVDEAVQMQRFKNSKEKRVINSGYKKIAIPELEIGDIVDYYYVFINTVSTINTGKFKRYEFAPFINTLNRDYPIVKGKISFLPERKCFINLSVSNGAPKPFQKTRDGKNVFVIEYGDLEKNKTELWTYPFRQDPTIKFQVIIAPSYISTSEKFFLGYPEILKTSVKDNELKRLLKLINGENPLSKDNIKMVGLRFLDRHRLNKNQEQLIEELYYFYRHYLYFSNSYKDYNLNYYYIDRFDFIEAFSKVLSSKKIEHSVFLGVPKSIGTIDSVVLLGEVVPGIRVIVNDKPVYIFNPEVHSVFGEGDFMLEGTKILSKKNDKNKKSCTLIYDSIPVSSCSDNYQFDSVFVVLDSNNNNNLRVSDYKTSKGNLKEMFNENIRIVDEYLHNEYEGIGKIKKTKKKDLTFKKYFLKHAAKQLEKESEYRREAITEFFKQSYDVEDLDIDTFRIISQGRFSSTSDISFCCELVVPEFIRYSKNYLIMDAGKLIGKNVDLNQKEKNREKDVYIPTPRQFDWVVNIEIPKGYSIENVDNFNYSVENNTGGFVSEASIGDKYVTLKASKYYLHNYEPIEKWPELLEFLEAANDFVQQKMVFVKEVENNVTH